MFLVDKQLVHFSLLIYSLHNSVPKLYIMCGTEGISLAMSAVQPKKPAQLSQSAINRLLELKSQYLTAQKTGDNERISQIKHMVSSIRAGETFYIYDLPSKSV